MSLGGHSPACVEEVTWPDDLRLRVATYLTSDLDPGWSFSSARAVVLRGDEVLVVHDPTSVHILPGGRLAEDETLDDALRRELREEAGCTIGMPEIIGVLEYEWLRAPTDGRQYTSFLQAVFAAVSDQLDPGLREHDSQELAAAFVPIKEAQLLLLTQRERVLLNAAKAVLGATL